MKHLIFRLLAVAIIGVAAGAVPETAFAQEASTAVQAFDPAAETEKYLATISGEQREKSDAYYEGGYWLILWTFLYGLGVAYLLLRKGFSARIRSWCEIRSKRPFLQTFLYGGIYVFLASLLTFPWTVYTGFFREHKYELANQAFGPWLSEQMIGLVISLVAMSFFVAVIYTIIRKVGDKWWIWGTGVTALFMLFMIMVSPVFVAPLFNKYTPLEEGPVKTAILTMAAEQGVAFDNVYMVDASAQSTRISANVSGLGATKRISLNDNLLNSGSVQEIKAVMGHELGHYVLNHLIKLVAAFTAVLGLGYFLTTKGYHWAVARWGHEWGIKELKDVAGLPLAAAIFSAYLFIMTPVFNSIIRINESDADWYGLEVAKEPDGFASIAMKLAQYRKLDPGPLEEMLFFDHPSGRTRVEMAMKWKAANVIPATKTE